jgi:hypothetical protein
MWFMLETTTPINARQRRFGQLMIRPGGIRGVGLEQHQIVNGIAGLQRQGFG